MFLLGVFDFIRVFFYERWLSVFFVNSKICRIDGKIDSSRFIFYKGRCRLLICRSGWIEVSEIFGEFDDDCGFGRGRVDRLAVWRSCGWGGRGGLGLIYLLLVVWRRGLVFCVLLFFFLGLDGCVGLGF